MTWLILSDKLPAALTKTCLFSHSARPCYSVTLSLVSLWIYYNRVQHMWELSLHCMWAMAYWHCRLTVQHSDWRLSRSMHRIPEYAQEQLQLWGMTVNIWAAATRKLTKGSALTYCLNFTLYVIKLRLFGAEILLHSPSWCCEGLMQTQTYSLKVSVVWNCTQRRSNDEMAHHQGSTRFFVSSVTSKNFKRSSKFLCCVCNRYNV